MRVSKPKPRKVQKYMEIYYNKDINFVYFLSVDGTLEFVGRFGFLLIGGGRERMLNKKFYEFVGEIKP